MAKIITTDDASLMRDILGEMIRELGHTVTGVGSGEELLAVYDKEKPDVVFLDIIMDDNGLEVLKKLRTKDPNAKVVICSSIGGMQYIMDEAREKGAVTCIRKPFTSADVNRAIQMCLPSERDR